jgi:hypothetical protein
VTTPSKLPEFPETQNPAEALIQHLETLPSSDDINGESSVSESADRLFLWESVPKLGSALNFSVPASDVLFSGFFVPSLQNASLD